MTSARVSCGSWSSTGRRNLGPSPGQFVHETRISKGSLGVAGASEVRARLTPSSRTILEARLLTAIASENAHSRKRYGTSSFRAGPREGVPDEIRRVIHERLEVADDRITLDASFKNDLGADSLALEEAFDIDITDDAADKIRTVRDAEFIEKHAQVRPSA
jgi:acyl carrier protein